MNLEENLIDEVERDDSAPRFGIIHLISWTASIALFLAVFERFKQLAQADESWTGKTSTREEVITVIYAAISASALAGVFWLWDWRRRKGPFALRPGHWILLILGLTALVSSLVGLALTLIHGQSMSFTGTPPLWYLLPDIITGLVALVILGFAFAKSSRLWGLFFLSWASWQIKAFLDLYFLWSSRIELIFRTELVSILILAATVIVFLVAMASDLWKRTKRDWIHWFGLLCLSLTATFMFVLNIYYSYFN